jgi:hypothetical protein
MNIRNIPVEEGIVDIGDASAQFGPCMGTFITISFLNRKCIAVDCESS